MKFKDFINETYIVGNDPFFRLGSFGFDLCQKNYNERKIILKRKIEEDLNALQLPFNELSCEDHYFFKNNFLLAYEVFLKINDVEKDQCQMLRRRLLTLGWYYLYQQNLNDKYTLYKPGMKLEIHLGINGYPVINVI